MNAATRTLVALSLAILCLAIMAACSSPSAQPPARGILAVVIEGLPSGVSANVNLSGPGGYSRAVTASRTISNLSPGTYTISAAEVSSGGNSYLPDRQSQSVTVTANATATATVRYSQQASGTAQLEVDISGLPGNLADVTVSGPANYSRKLTSSTTLANLGPGDYSIIALSVSLDGSTYVPSPASQSVSLAAGESKSASVAYSAPAGNLQISVTGLPAEVDASISVTGPQGYSQSVTGSTTLSGLVPGSYSITAGNVTSGGESYVPDPLSQSITVSAGATVTAQVSYALQAPETGNLSLSVTGLPAGVSADVTVSGPNGYSQSVSGSTTLTGLVPGSYTISASDVTSGGNTFAPSPPSQSVTVSAGGTATASVAYTPQGGSLQITITGLPDDLDADVTVTGPAGYSQSVTSSTTLDGLAPGAYVVSAQEVSENGDSYAPEPASQEATVTSNATATVTVNYELQEPAPEPETGSLELEITGLPEGVDADVTVTGPDGFSESVEASATLANLTPGGYTVSASDVAHGDNTFAPSPASQSVTVSAGSMTTVTVTYELQEPDPAPDPDPDPEPAPDITEPQPNPLEMTAEVNQSTTGTFSFGNAGNAELAYTVTVDEAAEWLAIIGGQEGTVAPGESATVTLQATCPDTAGTYEDEVTINSNGPDEPAKAVTVNLECMPDPDPNPNPGPGTFELVVILIGDGGGAVHLNPPNIECEDQCSEAYDEGVEVVLTVFIDSGFSFVRWFGDCESFEDSDTCVLVMTEDREVMAWLEWVEDDWDSSDWRDDADPVRAMAAQE